MGILERFMKFTCYTLGCKVNQYETQAMERQLTALGHTLCPNDDDACDAYIINTCTVTAVADRKNRTLIRRLRREHPEAVIGVCGCYAQLNAQDIAALGVDVVSGSAGREEFVQLLLQKLRDRSGGAEIQVDEALRRRAFEELPAGGLAARTRAMLKVQDGCNNFCTYCIIPYARGPVRSLPMERAVEQARGLAAEGYREIVVTGIEIASWGWDFRDGSRLPGGPVAPAGVEHGLWTSLAKTPAHYGLHATLKAPFELRSTSEGMLVALKNACRKVAERHASWLTAPLGLQRLPVHSGERQASFLALVPRQGDSASESAMAALERDCVTELDRFRAPLDQRDVERREPLSLDERRNLLRWGYHHVLDLFRFPITLTGPLPHEGAEQVEAALNQYLEPVIDKPLAMDSVCLFCQADRALPFRLTTRFALARTGNA